MNLVSLSLIAALALVLVGCGTVASSTIPESAPPTIDTTLIDQGIAVYRRQYCGICHTLSVANTRGTFGPDHDTAGLNAAQTIENGAYAGEANNAAAYIRESILDPQMYYTLGYEVTNHHMPSFSHLPREDVDALVYLLVNQTGE